MLKTSIFIILGLGIFHALGAQQTIYSGTFDRDFNQWEVKDIISAERSEKTVKQEVKANLSAATSTLPLRTEKDQDKLPRKIRLHSKKDQTTKSQTPNTKIFERRVQVSTSRSTSHLQID